MQNSIRLRVFGSFCYYSPPLNKRRRKSWERERGEGKKRRTSFIFYRTNSSEAYLLFVSCFLFQRSALFSSMSIFLFPFTCKQKTDGQGSRETAKGGKKDALRSRRNKRSNNLFMPGAKREVFFPRFRIPVKNLVKTTTKVRVCVCACASSTCLHATARVFVDERADGQQHRDLVSRAVFRRAWLIGYLMGWGAGSCARFGHSQQLKVNLGNATSVDGGL